ncbi:MAG: hypothetical protein K9J06_14965 [Flavobacteriales bacterium]|nr:hypothetical protein [Flavobacteriales bacterium]
MTRTSTLPKSLLLDSRSLCDMGIEELLDDSALLDELLEEFSDIIIPAPVAIVERALAFSASFEVKPSTVLKDGSTVFLN